jgi:molybdopterin converting factor small subunit
MIITVALYAGLARFLPADAQGRKATIAVPAGSTVRDAMRRLGMSDDVLCIPVVNGVRVTVERVLQDGETLSLFPPLAGGGTSPELARLRDVCWRR